MASPMDNCELALLSSMSRQLVSYENGFNVIGGAPDLDSGMFWLLKHESFDPRDFYPYFPITDKTPKKMTGPELIQHFLPPTLLEYKDKSTTIENGKLIEFKASICDAKSEFLTFIQFHFG